jgi:hypothetical protein
MSGPFPRKVILRLCTSDRPYPIGRDEAVLAKSNHDFGPFPARVFGSLKQCSAREGSGHPARRP